MFNFGESSKKRQINLGGNVISKDKAKLLAKAKEDRRLRLESKQKEKSSTTIQNFFRKYKERSEHKFKLRAEFDVKKSELLEGELTSYANFHELISLLVGFFSPNHEDDQRRLLSLLLLSLKVVNLKDFSCKFILLPLLRPKDLFKETNEEDKMITAIRSWRYLIAIMLKIVNTSSAIGFNGEVIVEFYFTIASLSYYFSSESIETNSSFNSTDISYVLSRLPNYGVFKIMKKSLIDRQDNEHRTVVLKTMVHLSLNCNLPLQALRADALINELLTKVVLVSVMSIHEIEDVFLFFNDALVESIFVWLEKANDLLSVNITDSVCTLLTNLISFPHPKSGGQVRFFKTVVLLLNWIDKSSQAKKSKRTEQSSEDDASSSISLDSFLSEKDTSSLTEFQRFICDLGLEWILNRCIDFDFLSVNFEPCSETFGISENLMKYLTYLVFYIPKIRPKFLNELQKHPQPKFISILYSQVRLSSLFSSLPELSYSLVKIKAKETTTAWCQIYLLLTLLYDRLIELDISSFADSLKSEYPLDTRELTYLVQCLGVWLCPLYYESEKFEGLLDQGFGQETPFTLRHLRSRATDLLKELHSNRYVKLPISAWNLDWHVLRMENFVEKVAEHLYNQFNVYDEESHLGSDQQDSLVTSVPFLIPFELRLSIFSTALHLDQNRSSRNGDFHTAFRSQPLTIRRDFLLEDGLATLNPLQHRLKHKVSIALVSAIGMPEIGVDGGGVFKEFLNLFIEQAFHPQTKLFVCSASQQLYPNPDPWACKPDNLQLFGFLGRIVGKALYEGILMDLHFAPFFLNLWLNRKNTMYDLKELDPQLHQGLSKLRNMDPARVEELELDFSMNVHTYAGVTNVNLVPNGSHVPVINQNLTQYLEKVIDYKLHRQIHRQTEAFLDGLKDLVPLQWLQTFDSLELSQVLGGNDKPIDVDDLQAHVTYSGVYDANHPQIAQLWQIVRGFSDLDKSAFLRFVTSCPRPPLLGFQQLDPPLCIRDSGRSDARLPSASTCVNLLKLPLYSSKEVLEKKLIYSIKADAGFELS